MLISRYVIDYLASASFNNNPTKQNTNKISEADAERLGMGFGRMAFGATAPSGQAQIQSNTSSGNKMGGFGSTGPVSSQNSGQTAHCIFHR